MIQFLYKIQVTACYVVVAGWIVLTVLVVFNFFRSNNHKAKLYLLYLINSSVFYLAGKHVLGMLYDISQSSELPELSMEDVNRDLVFSLINTSVFIALLTGLNFIYSNWILKKVEMKTMIKLFLFDLVVLLLGIYLARQCFLELVSM